MTQVRVVKSLFVETGTYNDVYNRPYQAHITTDLVNEFNELTQAGLKINSADVAGVAGKILNPSTVPMGTVSIDNGWSERRMRFTIEFEIASVSGRPTSKEVITGYTDHPGGTMQGSIDPMMRCYINNVFNLRIVREHLNGFVRDRTMLAEAAHVVTKDHNYQVASFNDVNQKRLMRPEDVVGAMMLDAVVGKENVGSSIDIRNTLLQPKKSKRSNGLATKYVSEVVSSLNTGYSGQNQFLGTGAEPFEEARSNCRENLLTSDSIISLLNLNTSYLYDSYVTYQDLCRIFPDLDSVTVLVMKGNTVRTFREAVRGDCETWNSSTMETVAATILSNSVPSIMSDLMLAQVTFVSTNRTLTGEIITTINNSHPFTEGMDMSQYLQVFVNRLNREVLFDLSKFNQMDYAVQAVIDLLGDSFITISINGGPNIEYVMPSFCDALASPVVSYNTHTVNQIAYNLNSLFENSRRSNGHEYTHIMQDVYQPDLDYHTHPNDFNHQTQLTNSNAHYPQGDSSDEQTIGFI